MNSNNPHKILLLAPLYSPRNQSLERLINLFIFTQLVTGRDGICNYLMPYLTVNTAFYILQELFILSYLETYVHCNKQNTDRQNKYIFTLKGLIWLSYFKILLSSFAHFSS